MWSVAGYGDRFVEYDDRGSGHRPSCATCGYLPPHRFGFRMAEPERVKRIRVTVVPERTELDTGCSWDCKVDALFQSWSIAFPAYSAADSSTANFDPIDRERITDRDVTAQMRTGGRFTVGNEYRFLSDGGRYAAQARFRVMVRIELAPRPLVDQGWAATDACTNLARTVRNSGLCASDAVCTRAPPLAAHGCYEALSSSPSAGLTLRSWP